MPRLCLATIEGKGRGVFAGEDIAEGGVIDMNPALIFPHSQTEELKPPLQYYPFNWDKNSDCIPLGSVTLANHSQDPNAFVQRDVANQLIRLVAKRNIAAGEEITYDYKVPLWFEPRPPARLPVANAVGGAGVVSDGNNQSL
jgi:SET domain-containing protein